MIDAGAGALFGPAAGNLSRALDEVGIRIDNGEEVVKIDPSYYRPAEVQTLLGDPSKAKIKLGWEAKSTLEELVSEMISVDLKIAKRDAFNSREF